MKATIDIIILSMAFWLAAAKLFMALHPNAIEAPKPEPSFDVIEQRASPDEIKAQQEIEAAKQKANEEVIAAKVQAEAVERKAKTDEATAKKLIELEKQSAANLKKQADEVAKQAGEAVKKALESTNKAIKQVEESKKKEEAKPIPPPVKQVKEDHHWTSDLNAAKQLSTQTNTPIFVAFEGEGCAICETVSKKVYASPEVSPVLRKEFIPVWLYVDEEHNNHLSEFQEGDVRTPLAVVIKPNGDWRSFVPKYDFKLSQTENIDEFVNNLRSASR